MPNQNFNVPTSGDSSSQAQSRVINIPGLTSVTSVTVNTGSVTYSVSGENVTVNCNGGTSVRSEYVDSGYTDNKIESVTVSGTKDWWYEWNGSSWTYTNVSFNPSSYNYNVDGYTGTLSYSSSNIPAPPYPSYSGNYIGQSTYTTSSSGTITFSGNVSKYISSSYYNYYYAYVVTINYVTYTKKGTMKLKTATTTVTIPIYDLNYSPNYLRVQTSNGTGCFGIVATNDVKASPIRINTQSGVKAIMKE